MSKGPVRIMEAPTEEPSRGRRLIALGLTLIITLIGVVATVLVANTFAPTDQCEGCGVNAVVGWLYIAMVGLLVTGFVAGLSSREVLPGVAALLVAEVVLVVVALIVVPDASFADRLPKPYALLARAAAYGAVAAGASIPVAAGFFGGYFTRGLVGRHR
jgi:MFS family permease